jgi:ribosomal protein L13E
MKILLLIEKKWKTLDERIAKLQEYLADKNRLGSIYGSIQIDYKIIKLPELTLQENGIYAEKDILAITSPYHKEADAVGVLFPVVLSEKYRGNYYPNNGKDYKLDFYIKANEKTKDGTGFAFEEFLEHEIAHAVALDIGLKSQGTNKGYVAGADNTHFFFYGKNKDGFYKEINEHWKKKSSIFAQTLNLLATLLGQKKNPVSKYFTEEETKGLQPELVAMLEKAREIAGIPFVITSGFRTTEKNESVGGVKDSSHTQGLAVDLRARNSNEHFIITKALMEAGFTRISKMYKTHIHADIDNTKPQNVLF